MSPLKFTLATAICISFVLSAAFSVQSFTGYLVSDIVNNKANLVSLSFFLIGILGAWLFLAKFKKNEVY